MRLQLFLVVFAGITWSSLWLTPDQRGQRLLRQGDFQAAAESFRDPMWQGVAWYRGGEFEKAEQAFARLSLADADFNRGNCQIMRGKYQQAIESFDRALEARPGWEQAENNREVAVARAKMVERSGGDMGEQKLGADDVVFDKNKKSGGQETVVTGEQPMSDSAMQALWLRRIQTKPAEFLRAKFAYQLAAAEQNGTDP